jgi:hypothetical protein
MPTIERVCANTSCNKAGIHLCSGCGEEIYCSKECQKSHWHVHKQHCQTVLNPKQVSSSKSLETLSIKQLKNAFKAKAATLDQPKREKLLEQLESLVEKPALIKFVSDFVKPSEIEHLLSVPESSSKTTRKKSEKRQNTPTPTPEQMKQQAEMMRKNPELVRRSNQALAHLSDQQIRDYADQLEQVINFTSLSSLIIASINK